MTPGMIQICSKCGYTNAATGTRCKECGARLPAADSRAAGTSAARPADPTALPPKRTFWQRSGGWVTAAIVLFMVMVGGQTATLTCSRTAPRSPVTCVRESRFLRMLPTGSAVIEDVRSAHVEEMSDEDGTSYRVVLDARSGEVPLIATYTSGYSSKQEAANAINAFVHDPERMRVTVEEPGMITVQNLGCVVLWIVGSVVWGFLESTFKLRKAELKAP